MNSHSDLGVNGYKKVYQFSNGFGASVICSDFSYGGRNGLFEVAVLDRDGNISYDTPITADVIGWLTFSDVAELLHKIENL